MVRYGVEVVGRGAVGATEVAEVVMQIDMEVWGVGRAGMERC